MASKSLQREWRFGGSLNKIYPYGAQEWNVNWINKTSGENRFLDNELRQQLHLSPSHIESELYF